jgi:hypothetical protein
MAQTAMQELRTDCSSFELKDNPNDCGDCQTDGHFLCSNCKHIASFKKMELSDNRMRYYDKEEKESLKRDEVCEALHRKGFYNPYNVFHHAPEFYSCEDERYDYKIHIVKWNTRSTRMTILYARYDNKNKCWVFSKKMGIKRSPHGEKMR